MVQLSAGGWASVSGVPCRAVAGDGSDHTALRDFAKYGILCIRNIQVSQSIESDAGGIKELGAGGWSPIA
jgi:hypothetical protein